MEQPQCSGAHLVSREHIQSTLLAAGFEPSRYAQAHADLAGLDEAAACRHFIDHGADERRIFPVKVDTGALRQIGDKKIVRALVNAWGLSAARSGQDVSTVCSELLGLADLGCRPYLVMGDSHSDRYCRFGTRGHHWLGPVHLSCSAGSARGLGNPRSRSGYGSLIRRNVASLVQRDIDIPMIVQFGQVDTEFVSIFNRIKQGSRSFSMHEAQAFNLVTIGAFVGFMRDCVPSATRHRVNVASLFPPSLSDEKWAEGYINGHILSLEAANVADISARIRELEVPSFRQRTELHAHYNEHLERHCRREGFGFVDGFSPLLGENGLLDQRWIAETQGADHHVDHMPTTAPIESLLWSLIGPQV